MKTPKAKRAAPQKALAEQAQQSADVQAPELTAPPAAKRRTLPAKAAAPTPAAEATAAAPRRGKRQVKASKASQAASTPLPPEPLPAPISAAPVQTGELTAEVRPQVLSPQPNTPKPPRISKKAAPQAAVDSAPASQASEPSGESAPQATKRQTSRNQTPRNQAPKPPRGGRSSQAKAAQLPESEEAPEVLLSSSPAGEALGELEAGASTDLPQTPLAAPAPVKTRAGKRERPARAPTPAQETSSVTEAPAQSSASEAPHGQAAVSSEARDLIIEQLRKLGRPVHVRDFERTFTRQGREKLGVRHDLAGLLEDLTHSGDVIRTRRHTYGLPEAMNLVRGRFQASTAGFGFVIPDSGGDDFYIREGETLEAWNGDTVLIRPEGRSGGNDRPDYRDGRGRGNTRRNDSPRAAVVRIVNRAYSRLVGSLDHQATYAFLKPDDHRARHRIMLLPDGTEGLPNGARVVTQLFWPEDTGEDEVYGEIVRVLGNEDDPATETQAVIVKYGLRDEFPEDVLREAAQIAPRGAGSGAGRATGPARLPHLHGGRQRLQGL